MDEDVTRSGEHSPAPPISPKDRFVTIYGRNPVLEALRDPSLAVDKVLLAATSRGPHVGEIRAAARARGIPIQIVDAERVKKIAGNGKQDQGVCADVVAPRMRPLALVVAEGLHGPVLVLDGITTPANVGMILRTATAAGFAGIVVPRRGVASIDPMGVKASAGVAFKAPILKVATALEAVQALREAGYRIAGLDADGPTSLFGADLGADTAYVMGGETSGLGADVSSLVDTWVSIPMSGAVESLNVSAAAAVVCFDVVRRGLSHPTDQPEHAPR